MFITDTLINKINAIPYNKTTLAVGARASIIYTLNSNDGGNLYDVLETIVTKSNKKKWLENVGWTLNSMIQKAKLTGEAATVFSEVSHLASEKAKTIKDTHYLRFTTPEEEDAFESSLTGVEKALCKLYRNGLKPEDIVRDQHRLSKVGEGVIEVVGNTGRTKARTIESDNAFGLTPDEVNDLLPILKNSLPDPDGVGLASLSSILRFSAGWDIRPGQLRASHGERLLLQGKTYAEVGELHGMSGNGVRVRQQRYRQGHS